MVYLYIYLVIIALLIVLYLILHNHKQKITTWLNQWIDKILYFFDRTIYFRKNALIDYDAAKRLLFHNQKKFFSSPSEYTDLLPLLLQDADYLSSLVNQDIVPIKDKKELLETQEVWVKLHTIKKYTYTILIILTLGIGKILLPR